LPSGSNLDQPCQTADNLHRVNSKVENVTWNASMAFETANIS
jgi:hypothetical protein